MCLSALPMLAPSAAADDPAETPIQYIDEDFSERGYLVDTHSIYNDFASASSNVSVTVSAPTKAYYQYSSSGLNIHYNESSYLRCAYDPGLINHTAIWKLTTPLDAVYTVASSWQAKTDPATNYYSIEIVFTSKYVALKTTMVVGGVTSVLNDIINYEASIYTEHIFALVVDSGTIELHIGGATVSQTVPDIGPLNMRRYDITGDTTTGLDIVLSSFTGSDETAIGLKDVLRKTVTPWGYDLTFALQIHADGSSPDNIPLLRQLMDDYGIRGDLNVWVSPNDAPVTQYTLEDLDYLAAVLELQANGYEIGTHALSHASTERALLLEYLAEFESQFGPLRSWVDHGTVEQDIWKSGADPSSPYYIADVLAANGVMFWANDESADSAHNDLNADGVYYTDARYPGLGMQYSSANSLRSLLYSGFLNRYSELSYENCTTLQSHWAASGSVLILHEYITRLGYWTSEGVDYALQGTWSEIGYSYTQDAALGDDRGLYQGGQWTLFPFIATYFDALSQFNVYSAPVYDIWSHSRLVQASSIVEDANGVTVTNPSSQDIDGYTMTTNEQPCYCLYRDGMYYYPHEGKGGAWQFVVDVPRGFAAYFQKVELPSFTPSKMLDSSDVVLWGDGTNLYAYALESGDVHLNMGVNYTDYLILDESGDRAVCPEPSVWTAAEGETYIIWSESAYRRAQLDAAMSPLWIAVPVVISLTLIGGLFAMVGRLKF